MYNEQEKMRSYANNGYKLGALCALLFPKIDQYGYFVTGAQNAFTHQYPCFMYRDQVSPAMAIKRHEKMPGGIIEGVNLHNNVAAGFSNNGSVHGANLQVVMMLIPMTRTLNEYIKMLTRKQDSKETNELAEHYRELLTLCRHTLWEFGPATKAISCYDSTLSNANEEHYQKLLAKVDDEIREKSYTQERRHDATKKDGMGDLTAFSAVDYMLRGVMALQREDCKNIPSLRPLIANAVKKEVIDEVVEAIGEEQAESRALRYHYDVINNIGPVGHDKSGQVNP